MSFWTPAQYANALAVVANVRHQGLFITLKVHTAPRMGETIDGYPERLHPDGITEVDLRVECPEGTCNVTGHPEAWNGRWWRLSKHMTDGEIVQTAFKAVLTALEHEARERFTYKGVSVFDPHYDIEALVALRQGEGGGLKERTHG